MLMGNTKNIFIFLLNSRLFANDLNSIFVQTKRVRIALNWKEIEYECSTVNLILEGGQQVIAVFILLLK